MQTEIKIEPNRTNFFIKPPAAETPVSSDGVDTGPVLPKVANKLKVLILQHPQEKKKELATLPIIEKTLENLTVKIGFSWGSLARALGEKEIDNKKWAVLYLGTAKDKALSRPDEEVLVVTRAGKRLLPDLIKELEGIVVLDGNWKQAKTLWWRNSWFLKLNRIVLNPKHKSLYGNMRKEPRPECLSTLESVALVLRDLEKNEAASTLLLERFKSALKI